MTAAGSERFEFVTCDDEDVPVVVEAVLGALRPTVTAAWIDAFSEGEWPPRVEADVTALRAVEQRLLSSGARRRPTGMGIDLDLTRDDEFGLLVRLAPVTIHAEAWAGEVCVFSSDDTGDHAWCALTGEQAVLTAAALARVGQAFEAVLRPLTAPG